MKKYFMILALIGTGLLNAQVGINTDKPKATLDVKALANGKVPNGLLIPRLDANQLKANNVSADHNSLLIYFNGDHTALPKETKYAEVTAKGYYYYDADAQKWTTFNVLKKLTENGKTGIVRVGRENDPGHYLEIGNHAVDLSYNDNIKKTTGASGTGSTAMGWATTASGEFSTAMGQSTTASGESSTAMGKSTTARGANSTAMGLSTTASGNYSTAMGGVTTASGAASTAMGTATTASGSYSTAMGGLTTAEGTGSTAMGWDTTASGDWSTAMGGGTTAEGNFSTAIGYETTASGLNSTAMGHHTIASGAYQLAIGRYNETRGNGTAFIIGNGSSNDNSVSSRSNAFMVDFDGQVYAKGNVHSGSSSFPDYVFEKYYKGSSALKSNYTFSTLAEVEAYVKEKGHLPGYKSAKTIKEEGTLNMTETQLTNVEKIEELFLHTIEQEKAIKAKDAKISELEAALKAQGVKLKAQEARLEKLEQLIK